MSRDSRRLPPAYRELYLGLSRSLGRERVFCDPLRTLAFGTDASFYRLIPHLVVKAETVAELTEVLRGAARLGLPVTFRTAGTSLAGQAVTDSVLVLLAGAWRGIKILDGGARIALEPGVIGAEANRALAPHKRKIGPDPASIQAAMIGGIAANNASGMCCGTAQNSYQTVDSMKIVLWDGTLVDTADAASRQALASAQPALLAELAAIRDEIRADPTLHDRIARKYRIKNTTGYSLNAFVDFEDPVDILLHLMIGSEGTLGFIAEITYRTVPEHAHKASALILFRDVYDAARAVQALKGGPVAAAEMMDRASLGSVENQVGMPPYLAGLGPDACAVLVETRAARPEELEPQAQAVIQRLAGIATLFPVAFTAVKAEYERLWDVRKGLLPMVGGTRKVGTSVIIEDIVFPMQYLADGTLELRRLMHLHGYDAAIIFGHALDGNLHFTFMQDFGADAEVARYQRFMEDVCQMVVTKFDGALKGEHGTGRNMAPFVELEWGATAYGLMKRLKSAFDPHGLLNPGVILNDNPRIYLENLKPLPPADEIVDRCMECGFCEHRCCSRDLTISPRQRIVVWREIARLEKSGADPDRLDRLSADFAYFGDETCAADSLCAGACPLAIDTGKFVKSYRAAHLSPEASDSARYMAEHFQGVCTSVRAGLGAASAAHAVLGSKLMGGLARAARTATGRTLPLWTPAMPRPQHAISAPARAPASDRKVVYFPACVARTLGPQRAAPDERGVADVMLSILAKAGYDVAIPDGVSGLCCGMAFDSKGFSAVADEKSAQLGDALAAAGAGDGAPILCDTSPCTYTMKQKLAGRFTVHEPIEFIHRFLMDRLRFTRTDETVILHTPCSTEKMGLITRMLSLAEACAGKVIVPAGMACCGFAGDKGFTVPELNRSALAHLREQIPADCKRGYSNSRTCEIGLSSLSGIPYQSIVHLVDRSTAAR